MVTVLLALGIVGACIYGFTAVNPRLLPQTMGAISDIRVATPLHRRMLIRQVTYAIHINETCMSAAGF